MERVLQQERRRHSSAGGRPSPVVPPAGVRVTSAAHTLEQTQYRLHDLAKKLNALKHTKANVGRVGVVAIAGRQGDQLVGKAIKGILKQSTRKKRNQKLGTYTFLKDVTTLLISRCITFCSYFPRTT